MSTSRKKQAGVGCAAGFGSMVGLYLVSLLAFRFLWGWVVPDVLPGAVDDGLIAGALGWGASAKLAVPVALVGGMLGFHKGSES